jgi:hypothetical protein
MRIKGNVNEEYRRIRDGMINTNLIVDNPVITENGFLVLLKECIEGIFQFFELRVNSLIKIKIHKDMVASIIASLVLQKYKNIYFTFDVGRNTIEEVKSITGAGIMTESIRDDFERIPRDSWSLNLSGGVDSSLLTILCPELKLTSVSYTEPSLNEIASKPIFENLNSLVVNTNVSEFLFPRYSNGYFNLSSLLHADHFKIKYAINGKTMFDGRETLHYILGLTDKLVFSCDNDHEVYGVQVLYPLTGLSDIGTRKALYNLNKTLYETIANSYFEKIAPLGKLSSEKTQQNFLHDFVITGKQRNIEYNLPLHYLSNIYTFPYIVKNLPAQMSHIYLSGLDEESIAVIKKLDLTFYERYDPQALRDFPQDFKDYFLDKLKKAGVVLYTEKDYEERTQILKTMGVITKI